jgi:hypothetical protein
MPLGKARVRKKPSGRYVRVKLTIASIFAAITAALMLAVVPAAAESTWDQIKRTGKLRYGGDEKPIDAFFDIGSTIETGRTDRQRSGRLYRGPRSQAATSERCCRAQFSSLIGGRPSSVATVSVVTAL